MSGGSKIKKLVICSLCCALTCVCAVITIPIGVIPITLATVPVYISGAVLGSGYGAISQILYLLLVFVGLPFTSKLVGGAAYFTGPTAGYMVGYVPMAFIVGYVYKTFTASRRRILDKMFMFFVGAVIGTLVCYLFGTAWFSFQSKVKFLNALKVCVYPFLIGDFIKILVSMLIVPKIESAVNI